MQVKAPIQFQGEGRSAALAMAKVIARLIRMALSQSGTFFTKNAVLKNI
jgi:hypothetical protein